MQQNLKFPAQCTVIPAEELEQVSGGAPAWVGELKDQIRPYWQKAKPYLAFGIECGKAFVQVIAAAYSIYIYGRIIQDSMHGQPELVQGPELKISGYETSPCTIRGLNGAGGRLFVSLSGRFLICKRFYFVERKLCTLSNRFQIQLPQSQHLLCCPYSLLILGISCGFSRNLFKCSAHL